MHFSAIWIAMGLSSWWINMLLVPESQKLKKQLPLILAPRFHAQ